MRTDESNPFFLVVSASPPRGVLGRVNLPLSTRHIAPHPSNAIGSGHVHVYGTPQRKLAACNAHCPKADSERKTSRAMKQSCARHHPAESLDASAATGHAATEHAAAICSPLNWSTNFPRVNASASDDEADPAQSVPRWRREDARFQSRPPRSSSTRNIEKDDIMADARRDAWL